MSNGEQGSAPKVHGWTSNARLVVRFGTRTTFRVDDFAFNHPQAYARLYPYLVTGVSIIHAIIGTWQGAREAVDRVL